MTEILTESFCERCGTRYTFEPVDSRRRPLSGFGTLGRGIRHFVSDPGSSLDEAFAVARSEQEQRSTAHALEAFHRTFNFCLNCRQYTCGDCWNAVEGQCLTCAPTADAAEVPEPRVDMHVAVPPMDLAPAPAVIGAEEAAAFDGGPWIGSEAELQEKLGTDALASAQALAEAEAEAIATADAAALAAEDEARRAAELAAEADAAALEAAAEADAAARAAAEEEAQAAALEAARAATDAEAAEEQARLAAEEADRAAADAAAQAAAEAARAAAEEAARAAAEEARVAAEAAAQQAAAEEAAAQAALAFEPGQNLDDEIAAYERRLAAEPEPRAEETEPEVEPVAAEAEPEPVATEPEPEPVAAEAPTEELPIAAAAATPTPAAPIEPIPTAVGQPWPASVVDGPLSWPDPGVAAAAFEPHWPDIPVPARAVPPATSQPQPTVPVRSRGANLPAVSTPPQPVAAHACPSCGLSLSASARFCRRCGTPQQVASSPR